jgi:hypothetical protein
MHAFATSPSTGRMATARWLIPANNRPTSVSGGTLRKRTVDQVFDLRNQVSVHERRIRDTASIRPHKTVRANLRCAIRRRIINPFYRLHRGVKFSPADCPGHVRPPLDSQHRDGSLRRASGFECVQPKFFATIRTK